jgi:hypothetical protein
MSKKNLKDILIIILILMLSILTFSCDGGDDDNSRIVPEGLPDEAKQAVSLLVSSITISNTSEVLMAGPVEPGTILSEDFQEENNPIQLQIPDIPGTYYVFFIDDAPSKSYMHPVRFSYVNLDNDDFDSVSASYWMIVYRPNKEPAPYSHIAYELIDETFFLFVEGEGGAVESSADTRESITSAKGLSQQNVHLLADSECQKHVFIMDFGEKKRTYGKRLSDVFTSDMGINAFGVIADNMASGMDLMYDYVTSAGFSSHEGDRVSQYWGNDLPKYDMIINKDGTMDGMNTQFLSTLKSLKDLFPPTDGDCCHELFIALSGHGYPSGDVDDGGMVIETAVGGESRVTYAAMYEALNTLPSNVKLTLFIDACYAGLAIDQFKSFCDNHCGLTVITSVDKDHTSEGGNIIHSGTEDFLINGQEGDYDFDGDVGDLKDRYSAMLKESGDRNSDVWHCPFGINADWCSLDNDIYGCTDPNAINFSSEAVIDDGSCEYVSENILGCTDLKAMNFNPDATIDDGSCEYLSEDILGCTDPEANNYNPDATIDDGSCEYDSEEILGCTDSEANNFNPDATIDDGSCEYRAKIKAFCTGVTHFNGYSVITICVQYENVQDGAEVSFTMGSSTQTELVVNNMACTDFTIYSYGYYQGKATVVSIGEDVDLLWSINVDDKNQQCILK